MVTNTGDHGSEESKQDMCLSRILRWLEEEGGLYRGCSEDDKKGLWKASEDMQNVTKQTSDDAP